MFHPKYTSFLISLNVLHSIYNSQYYISLLESCVLLSSIIYHHNLIPNFRYYDIVITNSAILHHLYLYSHYITYEIYKLIPAFFYILAIGSYISGRIHNCNIYHGYLHIYGVIANILLIICILNDLVISN